MTLSERLYRRFVHKFFSRDLAVELQLHAKRDTVAYILENLQDASLFRDRWDQIKYAIANCPSEGLIAEFGVADGSSVNFMAKHTNRTIHGFDSFEGLPERWSGTFELAGKFSQGGKLPKVASNVILYKGWFDETIPSFLDANPGPIAFLHVDCDIYSSSKTIFDGLEDRLIAGSYVLFDEYFNYPNWRAHEFKAWGEFVERTGLTYEYVGLTGKNGHVLTKIVQR